MSTPPESLNAAPDEISDDLQQPSGRPRPDAPGDAPTEISDRTAIAAEPPSELQVLPPSTPSPPPPPNPPPPPPPNPPSRTPAGQAPKRRGLRRTRRVLRHPATRVFLVLFAVFLGWLCYSVGGALTRPGKDSVAARLAEWARDHHLNALVNKLEKIQYDMNKPRTGGDINKIPKAVGESPAPLPTASAIPQLPAHSPAPPPVALAPGVVPKPGEGQWQSVVFNGDLPAVRLTYVRPDDQHTSYLAALMWLDPKLLTATLHPGIQDPGGTWQVPSSITGPERETVAAAFPAGFRLTGATGSRGGWYTEGRMVTPLRDGAASFVIYKDGSVKIGQWGRDVSASPAVATVRQNLDLLVDNGKLDQSCSDNNSPKWGYTLGNAAFVPRTAIGQRADGSLIFVNSPATSVCSIGRLLLAAGVVRGMELDINPEWSIGFYYTHENGQVVGHPTRLDQSKAGDWYFSTQSRDFLSFALR